MLSADCLAANAYYAWTDFYPSRSPLSISLDLLGKHARALSPEEQGIVHER